MSNMSLEPNECLIRICRTCHKIMSLDYEWDIANRWYHFKCDKCGTTVHIGEPIESDIRDSYITDGELLEPLTEAEMRSQNSPEIRKMFDDNIFGAIDDNMKRNNEKTQNTQKHKMSEDSKMELT